MDTGNLNTPEIALLSDEELVKKLHSLKKWSLITKLIIPIGGVGGFGLVAFFAIGEMWVAMLLSIAIAVGIMLGLLKTADKRVITLKSFMGAAVTLPVIKEIIEVKDYQPLGHIKRESIRSAGLIGKWDRISGSDYIEGSYKGVNIRYSDMYLWHTEIDTYSDGKKSEKDVTDFKGQWLICDFGKELAATLRLIERKGGTRFNRTHDVTKSNIETESAAFNKKYRIITGDGHSAFYLLTPHFMEQLVAADEVANSSTLFCFMDGKVHIALYSGRDSFDLKGVKLDSMDNVRQKFRRDLKYMTDTMDELLRNDRLFKEA
jgi:hypothetical protein